MNRLSLNPLVKLRIGVVQFSPKIGQVQDNLAKAHEICGRIKSGTVDLLCFPEMVLTGYIFKNAASIRPHLEQPGTGITSRFCAEIAKKLQCYVFAGYPEALSSDDLDSASRSSKLNGSAEEVGANSAVLYGRDGEWIGGYRKTHLFEADKTWAKAGTGFATFTLPPPIHTVCLGICMDLNAQITGPYEIAFHCLSNKANVLVLLNAWLDSGKDHDAAYDWSTLNFWAARLQPLWSRVDDEKKGSDDHDSDEPPTLRGDLVDESEPKGKATVVVICNRCGEENGKF